jgi:hypothetical protein
MTNKVRREAGWLDDAGADDLAGELIEQRQQPAAQAGGEYEGKEADHDGFAEKLAGQLKPGGADDFADADFFGAIGRSGCRQVDKVDTCDEQDEKPDDGKDHCVASAAVDKAAAGRPIGVFQSFEGQHIVFLLRL